MGRQHIPLKARVVYEGKAQIIDRRAAHDADLEKVPTPVYHILTALRTKFGKRAVKNGANGNGAAKNGSRNGTSRAATKRKVTA